MHNHDGIIKAFGDKIKTDADVQLLKSGLQFALTAYTHDLDFVQTPTEAKSELKPIASAADKLAKLIKNAERSLLLAALNRGKNVNFQTYSILEHPENLEIIAAALMDYSDNPPEILKQASTKTGPKRVLIAKVAGLFSLFGGTDSHAPASIFCSIVEELFKLVEIDEDPTSAIKRAKEENYYQWHKANPCQSPSFIKRLEEWNKN